jgi:hypothetical protein
MNPYNSQIRLICDHLQAALAPLHQLECSSEAVPFYAAQARKLLEPVESFLSRMEAETDPDSPRAVPEATRSQSQAH